MELILSSTGPASLVLAPSDVVSQVPFDVVEICNSGFDSILSTFTLPRAGAWDLNCSIEGTLPVGWATANISLYVYKDGALFRRIDRRRYATGETEFLVAGSCQVYGSESTVITIQLSQSGAAPQTIATWDGYWDLHWAHKNDCIACAP